MKISGFQKLSLVDFDGHMAATIFTSGCNFACPFCHNSRLVNNSEKALDLDEILTYLDKRKNLIDAVCISGGEPTLYNDLPEVIKKIKDLGYLVKLDTNGTNPEMIEHLYTAGLIDYVAMDIKNTFDKYPLTAGKSVAIDNIKKSITYIMNCGIDYEFRTTLVDGHHTHEDIRSIAKILTGAKKYYLQKFEDSGECLTSGLGPVSKNDALIFQDTLKHHIQSVHLRGY